MDIRIRRVITIVFFLVFFIVSPFLLLYSSGYRYDFKRGAILRTGNIFIEAPDLREATIYLDGQPYSELLTKKLFIKNLLPGEYLVRIEKEGSYTWEKKLRVEPTLTTFVKDLILFTKHEPTVEIKKNIQDFSISPDKKLMAYLTVENGVQNVSIYNLEYPQEELIFQDPVNEPIQLEWATSSNKILVTTKDKAMVFKTSSFPIGTGISIAKKEHDLTRWDNQSDNFVYIASVNSINKYDLVTNTPEKIYQVLEATDKITDLQIESSNIIAIENDAQNTKVELINSASPSQIAALPLSENYFISEWTGNYLTVINRDLNKINLIRIKNGLDTSEILKENIITLDGSQATFSNDQQKLLITNDFELSYLDVNTRQVNLVSRFGQSIKKAMWYDDNQHVIINLDNKIIISDLSINTEKGTIQVTDGKNLNNAHLLNEKFLFFTGEVKSQQGLQKLRLR